MGEKLSGFLSGDSTFGRITNQLWIIIASNILFMICCIPVVTVGPAFAALHHVMLKNKKEKGEIFVFKEFWKGLKNNWKQALIAEVIVLIVGLVFWQDLRFIKYQGGAADTFRIPVMAVGIVGLIVVSYLFPVMVWFEGSLKDHMVKVPYFAAKNPLRILVILALEAVPVAVTYLDESLRPLYGFLWVTCLAGLILWLVDLMLYKDFAKMSGLNEEKEECL